MDCIVFADDIAVLERSLEITVFQIDTFQPVTARPDIQSRENNVDDQWWVIIRIQKQEQKCHRLRTWSCGTAKILRIERFRGHN